MAKTVFSLFDTVTLTKDRPDEGLKKGMQGAIIEIYTKPNFAYEVEFCDHKGTTLALVALLPEEIEPAL